MDLNIKERIKPVNNYIFEKIDEFIIANKKSIMYTLFLLIIISAFVLLFYGFKSIPNLLHDEKNFKFSRSFFTTIIFFLDIFVSISILLMCVYFRNLMFNFIEQYTWNITIYAITLILLIFDHFSYQLDGKSDKKKSLLRNYFVYTALFFLDFLITPLFLPVNYLIFFSIKITFLFFLLLNYEVIIINIRMARRKEEIKETLENIALKDSYWKGANTSRDLDVERQEI